MSGKVRNFPYTSGHSSPASRFHQRVASLKFSKSKSHSVLSDSLQPHGLYSPWSSPGQNTGVGSLSLLHGIFPTQELNPGLPCCRRILYQLSHEGSPCFQSSQEKVKKKKKKKETFEIFLRKSPWEGETEAQSRRLHTQGHRAEEDWPLLSVCQHGAAEHHQVLWAQPGPHTGCRTAAPAGTRGNPCWHPEHLSQRALGIVTFHSC